MPWTNTAPHVLLVALVGLVLVAGVFCPMGADLVDPVAIPLLESEDSLPGEPDSSASPFAFISSVFSYLSAPTMVRVLFPVDLAPAPTLWRRLPAASEPAARTAPLEALPGTHRALFLTTHALRI